MMFNDKKKGKTMKKVYEMMSKAGQWLASFGADRYLHLLAGLAVAFATCMVMAATQGVGPWTCALLGVIIVAAVGVGKEVLDQNYTGQSSWLDIIFTLIGGIVGCGLWML